MTNWCGLCNNRIILFIILKLFVLICSLTIYDFILELDFYVVEQWKWHKNDSISRNYELKFEFIVCNNFTELLACPKRQGGNTISRMFSPLTCHASLSNFSAIFLCCRRHNSLHFNSQLQRVLRSVKLAKTYSLGWKLFSFVPTNTIISFCFIGSA